MIPKAPIRSLVPGYRALPVHGPAAMPYGWVLPPVSFSLCESDREESGNIPVFFFF